MNDLFQTETHRPRMVVRETAATPVDLTPPARETVPAPAAKPSTADALLSSRAKPTGAKKPTGIIVVDPELVSQASQFIQANARKTQAEAAVEALKLGFVPQLRRAWFAANHGRTSPESSLKFQTEVGKLSVSFASQWFPKNDQVVLQIPDAFRMRKREITLDLSKVPEARLDDFVTELTGLLEKFDADEALSAKLTDYPTESFGIERHRVLTPDQNEALEQAGLSTRVSFR